MEKEREKEYDLSGKRMLKFHVLRVETDGDWAPLKGWCP